MDGNPLELRLSFTIDPITPFKRLG